MIKYTGYTLQSFKGPTDDTFYQGNNRVRITVHFTHDSGDSIDRVSVRNGQLGIMTVGANGSTTGILRGPIFVSATQHDIMLNIADSAIDLTDPFFIVEVYTHLSNETLQVAVDVSEKMVFNTPLEAYANVGIIDAAGRVSIQVSGIYNNNVFVNGIQNYVTVYWRYKNKSTGAWSTQQSRKITNTSVSIFDTTINITGLSTGGTEYDFEVIVKDLFSQPVTIVISSTAMSIFDWSETDFRVNVPAKITTMLELGNEKPITALNKSGASRELMALKSDNALHIGRGPYSVAGEGPTYIYGNQIHMLSNGPVTVNNQSITGLINALTNKYSLTVDLGVDANFSSVSASAYLMGTNLYLRYRNTQDSFNGVGYVKSYRILHGGKISGAADIISSISTSGSVGGMQVTVTSVDSTAVNFNITLTNAADATNVSMGCFVIPVTLNLNAYTV